MRKWIRAPDIDYSEPIKDNAKTLIGRVLNPKEQKIWQLIIELPKKWSLKGRVVGSDLDYDCFQFRFDLEEDLHNILLNRPYQFYNWMVVLQQWEPVISRTFPSHIPFWITLRGLPLHFWHESMICNIGFELGTLEDYKITKTSARIRITLDALKPFVTDSLVNFSSGEDIPITFEYENMANHCSICNMLTHSSRHCDERQREIPPLVPTKSETREKGRRATERVSRRYSSQELISPLRRHPSPLGEVLPLMWHLSNREWIGMEDHMGERVTMNTSLVQPVRNKISPATSRQPYLNQQAPRASKHYSTARARETNMQWRARERPQTPPQTPVNHTCSPHTTPAPLGRNLYNCDFPPPPSIPTTEEVMTELQDVTVQYINCAYPTESAARRLRVIQGETHGLMVSTAAGIIEATNAAANFIAGGLNSMQTLLSYLMQDQWTRRPFPWTLAAATLLH